MHQPTGIGIAHSMHGLWEKVTPIPPEECHALFDQYLNSFIPEINRAAFRDLFDYCDEKLVHLPARSGTCGRLTKLHEVLGGSTEPVHIRVLLRDPDHGGGVDIRGPVGERDISHIFLDHGDALAICQRDRWLAGLLWPHSGSVCVVSRVPLGQTIPTKRRHA